MEVTDRTDKTNCFLIVTRDFTANPKQEFAQIACNELTHAARNAHCRPIMLNLLFKVPRYKARIVSPKNQFDYWSFGERRDITEELR